MNNIETRLQNIEKQLSVLASKTSNRDTDNESNIINVSTKTDYTEKSITDGTWNPKTVYATDDYCMFNNSLYVCLWDCENVNPTNTTYWKQVNVATELNKLKSLIKEN